MGSTTAPTAPARRLIDVRAFAAKIGSSTRHALRLADSGAAPWGMKLGALRRWDEAELDAWIANGCPAVGGRHDATKGGPH